MPSNIPGYLAPQSNPAPLEDAALEDFLHDVLVGLSGLANELVRPAYQEEPPTQPERDQNWLAFTISEEPTEGFPAFVHDQSADGGDGVDEFQRHEGLYIQLMCYGPNANAIQRLIRDSIQVDQNVAVLEASGFGLQETTEIINAPVLAKSKWTRRFDMKIILRRIVIRNYENLNILESDLFLQVPLSKSGVTP